MRDVKLAVIALLVACAALRMSCNEHWKLRQGSRVRIDTVTSSPATPSVASRSPNEFLEREKVVLGPFEYTVLWSAWRPRGTTTEVGGTHLGIDTDSIIICVSATNKGTQPISVPGLAVINQQGAQHQSFPAGLSPKDIVQQLSQIRPGETRFGQLALSNPETSAQYWVVAYGPIGSSLQVGIRVDPKDLPVVAGTAATALSASAEEGRYLSAAGGYLQSLNKYDMQLAQTMAGARDGSSTLSSIKRQIERVRFIMRAAYSGDYGCASAPAGYEEIHSLIEECNRSHEAAFVELLQYWDDKSEFHLASGQEALKRGVLLTNKGIQMVTAKLDEIAARGSRN